MNIRELKPTTVLAGLSLCVLLSATIAGCGGGGNALGIGTPSVTVSGVAEAEISPATTATAIQSAAVAFNPLVGSAITGSTTDSNGNFTLSGVSGSEVGSFTFTNNTTQFTSAVITIPSNGGSLGNIVCTSAQAAAVVKK